MASARQYPTAIPALLLEERSCHRRERQARLSGSKLDCLTRSANLTDFALVRQLKSLRAGVDVEAVDVAHKPIPRECLAATELCETDALRSLQTYKP